MCENGQKVDIKGDKKWTNYKRNIKMGKKWT